MQFNSLEFLFFCVIFFALWPWFCSGNNRRWGFLTVASFVFYGWWDWRFVLLLVGNGLIDFYAAEAIVRWPTAKKFWLFLSLTGNLGALALFKYLNFLTVNLNELLLFFGAETQIPVVNLLLPVGISFYTFQSMSYTIDVYRGDLKPTHNLLHFFAYLALFPQLVAGPIVRAADLLPQLLSAPPVPEAMRWRGTQLVAAGLFKKMVIADSVAIAVNRAFGSPELDGGCLFWWLATAAFAVQIYCDFSGYSDIARGLANWMGYEFCVNFDHPYAASSLRDFWGRWHVSLSTWFRDYVYIPLGGSRQGALRSHVNMWVTMLISGIWHGANWTFVAWGAFHALFLSVERMTCFPERLMKIPGGRFMASLVTLMLVLVSWVFFRADNMTQALGIIVTMFDVSTFRWSDIGLLNMRSIVLAVLFLLVELLSPLRLYLPTRVSLPVRLQPALIALVLVSCVYFRGPGGTFIYFQF